MAATIFSAALVGIDAVTVNVEADFTPGQLGFFGIVGLPDAAVQESRERVRAAIKNSDVPFPTKRITINLAPADIRKQGPVYDLPIAMALLLAQGHRITLPCDIKKTIVIGELALDGSVRPVTGCISVVISAREQGYEAVIVPKDNALEASLIQGIKVFAVERLADVLEGRVQRAYTKVNTTLQSLEKTVDMADIRGQARAKRVLEIAAAGGHNILMSGPPGSGKTMLAKAIASIMPPLTTDEMIEVTKVHSAAGLLLRKKQLQQMRPFRSPHHTASGVALVGGGTVPRPGEISLAHRGILFLDEFPEFPRAVLEYLRQPLEDGIITVSRAAGSWEFPARVLLIAAMNPCPCGFATDPSKECVCSMQHIARYQQRLSGPLLDRIDLFVEVPRIEFDELTQPGSGETSKVIAQRVHAARTVQLTRHGVTNAEMNQKMIQKWCELDSETSHFLESAVAQMNFSARGYYRLLRVARTIADLAGDTHIQKQHLAEALQYRFRV